jgi:tetratricopeptide (TPR) repeat protein
MVLAVVSNPQPVESAPAAATAAPAAAAPAADPATDLKALRTDLDNLATRMKDVQARLEALPKAAPAPDLGPLQAKVDDLAKSSEKAAGLPKKIDVLEAKLGSVDKSIAALGDEVAALKSDVKKAAETATTPAASAPAEASGSGDALQPGIVLFKAGKYKEASDAFKKLTESTPDDARAWYLAALSNGMATNQWQGETLRMVNKGVEREKAGTPEAGKIDQAIGTFVPATAKTWFDYYRKLAKR